MEKIALHYKLLDVFKLQILLSNFGFLSTIVRAQLFLSLLDLFMNATVCDLLKSSDIGKRLGKNLVVHLILIFFTEIMYFQY